jgi:hypothetical protein
MRLTERVACAAVIAVVGTFAGSAAQAADQSFTGVVTILDRINNEMAIKQAPAGQTTGAATTGEVQKFRMRGAIPESVHAEDKVTVTYTESNGVKTISNVTEVKQ